MRIAKLTIGYDRGVKQNDERDLETKNGRGTTLADGSIIRGLGTKFRSQADKDLVAERDKAARVVYQAFRERFLSVNIDGLYAVPEAGVAKKYAESLVTRDDITVRVVEFDISTSGDLDAAEVKEWSDRIRRQLSQVQLGRKAETDEEGLRSLEYLASCPLLAKSTGARIKSLVEMLRSSKITRVELKRHLETLPVELDQAPLAPRRVPVLEVA